MGQWSGTVGQWDSGTVGQWVEWDSGTGTVGQVCCPTPEHNNGKEPVLHPTTELLPCTTPMYYSCIA